MALNSTIGLAYQVPYVGRNKATFVIDSFTNYPALLRTDATGPTYYVNASELTAFESDSLLRVPKEITCREMTSRATRSIKPTNPFMF